MSEDKPGYSPGMSDMPMDEIQAPDRWMVVVTNDHVNTINYVSLVFCKVFGFSRQRALQHTLEAHNKGESSLWSGHRERAEHYVMTLQKWQLNALLKRCE